MMFKSPLTSIPLGSAFVMLLAGGIAAGTMVPSNPARALVVYDPSNYAQNVLTAARTLQQVNNQIRSLQNQATSLLNEARNLSRIDFPELESLTQTLRGIDRLMGQATRIQYRVSSIDSQFSQLYPDAFRQSLRLDAQVAAARARLDTQVAAYR